MRRSLWLGLFISLLAPKGFSEQAAPKGTIKEAEFIIEKEKENLLPQAARFFEKAPIPVHIPDAATEVKYNLHEIVPEFNPLKRKIKILKPKPDFPHRSHRNYLKIGHGNYYTPYFTGFFDNTINARYAYGLHARHLSHGENKYLEESHNTIKLHGKFFAKTLILDGSLQYNQDQYPWARLSPGSSQNLNDRPHFHQIMLDGRLRNYLQDQYCYQVDGYLTNSWNVKKIQELQGSLGGEIDYVFNHDFTLKTIAELSLTQYGHNTTINRNLGKVQSCINFLLNDFKIQTGFNLVCQNDPSEIVNHFNAYPVLEISYMLYKSLHPYVGLGGDMQRTSWQGFVAENPWLVPHVDLQHTNQRFIFYGGALGEIAPKIDWHTGLSISSYQNLYYFVNEATEPRQFDMQYDQTTLFNVYSELKQANQPETFTTQLRGDYFLYKPQRLLKPWHKPSYRLELLSTYNLHNKILFKGMLYWLGGIEALDRTTQKAQRLADVVDLGLGIDYLWSQHFFIFLNCQNLLAKANARYLNAPATRGVRFLLGLSYAW